ncbi:alpha-2-macroglobulin family protein [bacterium]|nr:alpha-2-macroglobulin family protein [bacterium]
MRTRHSLQPVFFCAAILTALFLSTGCAKKQKPAAVTYGPEVARLISHVPRSPQSPAAEIEVRFTSAMAGDSEIGPALEKPVFQFDPAIKGKAFWKDSQTLVFKPEKPLRSRQSYYGSLALETLLGSKNTSGLKSLDFRFETSGQMILSSSGDFRPEKPGDPAIVLYEGSLSFSQPVEEEALSKAVRFEKDGKPVAFEMNLSDDRKNASFRTKPVPRTGEPQSFQLRVRKESLDLTHLFEQTVELPAVQDMRVVSIRKQPAAERFGLVVLFSDDLDARRDITGLVRVDPDVNVRATVSGKEIRLDGDFVFGETYTVTVARGIQSKWGTSTQREETQRVQLEDMKPEMRFAGDGVFLPSMNEMKLRFQTVNLKRVRISVQRVFESNLGQFLQQEQLSSGKSRNDGFYDHEMKRVGVKVAEDTLEIGETMNAWLQHEIDLSKIIPGNDGLFLVSLTFRKQDMMYGDLNRNEETDREHRDRIDWEDYYSSPYSDGYLWRHGRIYKPILVSDIGITCKKAGSRILVWTTQIQSGSALAGADVRLRSYQNQIVAENRSDANGFAEFKNVQEDVFYIEASKDGQLSLVKPGEMEWNLTGFDVGGEEASAEGMRACIYTDRGVYRPGDPVHLCLIARNREGSFPDNHPVPVEIFNPRNQKVFARTLREAKDGFYHLEYRTSPADPTGNWRVEMTVGSRVFRHVLRIETVAPYTLKVRIAPEQKILGPRDRILSATVQSSYLFGNPASGLDAEVAGTLVKKPLNPSKYPEFLFDHEAVEYKPIHKNLFSGALDAEGRARVRWELPNPGSLPSRMQAEIRADVLERGGRRNRNTLAMDVHPYPFYVGLKKPDTKWGSAQTGQETSVSVALVNQDGEPQAGRMLDYRIYSNRRYWWWEYEDRSDYRLRFKKDLSTKLIKQGTLASGIPAAALTFKPESSGEYLVEVADKAGHTAGLFFQAYGWGELPTSGEGADFLLLSSDKKEYMPGEKAVIRFPAPHQGNVVVCVEKGEEVLYSDRADVDGNPEMQIKIPITAEMIPNAYVTVSVLQPFAQTENDRPLRMYGVLPIQIKDVNSRQELAIETSESFEPNKPFKVKIRTRDGKPTQVTLAVVDEGLLDLTGFETPDPWDAFFRKVRLAVRTFDLFSQVIGANKGDVFKVFAIGGDVEEEYRKSQMREGKAQRFKPVALFAGPLMTNEDGKAEVEFEMPNYVGSVRIMLASARNAVYGSAEKTVPVRTGLMILPSLPRVLGPGDRITVPVSVFAMEDRIGGVRVSVKPSGPVHVKGSSEKELAFTEKGDKESFFDLEADQAQGEARITITAQSSSHRASETVDLAVRPSSPKIQEIVRETLEPGRTRRIAVPKGLAGTQEAVLRIQRRPDLSSTSRLYGLIHYPYGCIEQTVSAVFPQLFLKKVIQTTARDAGKIDEYINEGIERLVRFQLPSGGFTYWPGGRALSVWGTSYTGHFLVEAKKLGYAVPPELYGNWLRHQKSAARSTRDNLMERVYRVYLLALAGEPEIGSMNLLRENSLKDMSNAEKWLLAGSYKLAGVDRAAEEIHRSAGLDVKPYQEFGGTFGSLFRDKAMILEMLTLFGFWPQADRAADEIASALGTHTWYSTQTTGYMLLAFGKYLTALNADEKTEWSGTVRLPSGKAIPFKTKDLSVGLPIEEYGGTLEIELNKKAGIERAFAVLEWNGIPLIYQMDDVEKNISLSVEWLDEEGQALNPSSIRQGKAFWGHFQVQKKLSGGHIENLALVQVLPAGWEIDNTRLSGEEMPHWTEQMRLVSADYTDIRDDRIMWFFDLGYGDKPADFLVKLHAVTTGSYSLPPTLLEAMYNNDYMARKGGGRAEVSGR